MMACSPRRAAYALLLGALLAGCGKSGTGLAGAEAELNPVTPISAHGAAGQITRNTTRLGGADPVTDAAAIASAVHPGLTPAGRPQVVTFVRSDDFPVALAASVLASAPLGAPVLYSEAKAVPTVSVQALEAMRPTGSPALAGTQVLAVGGAAVPNGYVARSLPDREPFGAAVEVARLVERLQGTQLRHVLVVNAEGPPAYAMPAAALAAESGAPILFVTSSGVPPATSSALAALGHPNIYPIGPPSAISGSVVSQLERVGTVKRIAGTTPVENAIAVARFGEGGFGWDIHEAGHGLAFAAAFRPFDAPAAAALASSGDYAPLLLLESPDQVPATLTRYLEDIQAAYSPQLSPVRAIYNHGWIIGDEDAISASAQAQIDATLEVAQRSNATSPSLSP